MFPLAIRLTVRKPWDPAKYVFQSEFAKRFVAKGEAQGRLKGRAEGRVEIVLKLLQLRFGELPATTKKRVASASARQLDLWAERVLSAKTLAEVFKAKKH